MVKVWLLLAVCLLIFAAVTVMATPTAQTQTQVDNGMMMTAKHDDVALPDSVVSFSGMIDSAKMAFFTQHGILMADQTSPPTAMAIFSGKMTVIQQDILGVADISPHGILMTAADTSVVKQVGAEIKIPHMMTMAAVPEGWIPYSTVQIKTPMIGFSSGQVQVVAASPPSRDAFSGMVTFLITAKNRTLLASDPAASIKGYRLTNDAGGYVVVASAPQPTQFDAMKFVPFLST
jgi:hypothetical protein